MWKGYHIAFVDPPEIRVHTCSTVSRAAPTAGRHLLTRSQFARTVAEIFEKAPDVDAALETCLRVVCALDGWALGQAWMPRADGSSLEWRTAWITDLRFTDFRETSRAIVFAPEVPLPGRAWTTRETVVIPDLEAEPGFYRSHAASAAGLRSAIALPLVASGNVLAVLEFVGTEPRTIDEDLPALVATIAGPLGALIERRRAQAHEESADRIRGLFESPTIGIVFWERDGRVVEANQAFLNTVGYTREEMISGRLTWERISPPDERLDEWVFRQIEATGVCPPFEKECVRKDGQRVPVLLGGSFAPDSRGAVCYVLDVTEQRRVADALRESEERFRAFMDNTPAVAFMKDGDGRHLYHNVVWSRVFDLPHNSAIGKHEFEIFPPDVAANLRENDRAVLQAGHPMEFWERVPTADGVMRDWLVLKFPFEASPGRRLLGGVALDMTERRRMEAALNESEARYRTLVEHSPDAIFLMSGDQITFVNGAGVRMLGAEGPHDIVGKSAFDIVHPGYHELVRDRLRQHAEGRRFSAPAEQTFVRADGSTVDVDVFAIPFNDGESTLQVVARDITERKIAERERSRVLELEQDARAQSEALSRKLVDAQESERRRIARELHDEVGQMLTGLSLILKSAPTAPASGKRLAEAQALIHDLTARVREMSLALRPAMLDDLGLLAALLWQFERYTSQTGVRVGFHHYGLDRRFPADVETAAYRLVQEALTNVARHAQTHEADVHVRSRSDVLWLRVADRGVGFDPARGGRGDSMGLVGMRDRVSSLGGELRVDSSPGQGTFLTAWLPLPAGQGSQDASVEDAQGNL
jgi:PAS domain S-box-containing protein